MGAGVTGASREKPVVQISRANWDKQGQLGSFDEVGEEVLI